MVAVGMIKYVYIFYYQRLGIEINVSIYCDGTKGGVCGGGGVFFISFFKRDGRGGGIANLAKRVGDERGEKRDGEKRGRRV